MNVGRYIFAQITDFIPRYVFDKAYIDLKQMWCMQLAGAFFVMRPKDNMRFEVTREFTDDRLTSFVCADYAVRFTGYQSKHSYPDELRIVKVNDPESGERVSFITNNFDFNPLEILISTVIGGISRYSSSGLNKTSLSSHFGVTLKMQ